MRLTLYCGAVEILFFFAIILYFPQLFSVFLRSDAKCASEYVYEIGTVGIPQCKSDVFYRHVGCEEKMLAFLYAFPGDVLYGGISCDVFEESYKMFR